MSNDAERRSRRIPELAHNPITWIGAFLALFAFAAIVVLYLLSVFSGTSNPYLGIFILVVFPAVMVVGLLLIPLGMLREKRRREAHGERQPFVVDLRNRAHRTALLTFMVGTAIFVLATTIGLYETYHYTESTEFCGQVCHAVMGPERTAHEISPHSRVACVHCHVGPGGDYYLKSKMAGARQLFHYVRGDYHRPIETPIYTLRPSSETCGNCHSLDRFVPAKLIERDHYLSDEKNRHWQLKMLLPVGGQIGDGDRQAGIHWHTAAGNRVTYVAEDSSRQAFESVTWYREGTPIVYSKNGRPLTAEEMAQKEHKGLVRTMDCTDCHNRPAHRYKSPMEAVNEAFGVGRLDSSVPFLKRESVRALSKRYRTREESLAGIGADLRAFYSSSGIELPAPVVQSVQRLSEEIDFPEMGARWDVYPTNDGHFLFPGCFRCHGSSLVDSDGRNIRADCDLCHSIVAQGFTDPPHRPDEGLGIVFEHPLDVDGAELEMRCTECHIGDASLYQAQK